jgi:hypothetical protein
MNKLAHGCRNGYSTCSLLAETHLEEHETTYTNTVKNVEQRTMNEETVHCAKDKKENAERFFLYLQKRSNIVLGHENTDKEQYSV